MVLNYYSLYLLETLNNLVEQKTIYKKYNITLDGKKTYLFALRNLTLDEAKQDIKSRFKLSKITNIKESNE